MSLQGGMHVVTEAGVESVHEVKRHTGVSREGVKVRADPVGASFLASPKADAKVDMFHSPSPRGGKGLAHGPAGEALARARDPDGPHIAFPRVRAHFTERDEPVIGEQGPGVVGDVPGDDVLHSPSEYPNHLRALPRGIATGGCPVVSDALPRQASVPRGPVLILDLDHFQ